jgi:APA family basic amino acid/polyamine antiporter
MAANRHLPAALAKVDEQRRVPHRAEVLVGAVVMAIAALTDIGAAIGFSSFCVLFYYAVANASALTLGRRLMPAIGLVGCVLLAFALPFGAVIGGTATIAAAMLLYPAARIGAAGRLGRRESTPRDAGCSTERRDREPARRSEPG